MTTRKPVNRSVYEGADMISLRLRAAKKPAVIPFLEIPPEEIELEPATLEPVVLTDVEPMPIMPLIVPANEILPFDDDEDMPQIAPRVVPASDSLSTPESTSSNAEQTPAAPGSAAPSGDGLSLFGVGTIIDKKPRGKKRGH